MKDTINSHLVSKVILKQFATKGLDKKWRVVMYEKDGKYSSFCDIDYVACREVNRELIDVLEQEWSKDIEDKAYRAINSVTNNNWTDKHIGVIKELIALHFIRSQTFELVDSNKDYIFKTLEANRDKVVAMKPESIDIINKIYFEYRKSATLTVAISILKEFVDKTRRYLSDPSVGIELYQAPDDAEFIIGDVPVITVNRSGRVVPITEADHVVMPLSPKYLVALKTHSSKRAPVVLTKRQVENANAKQVDLAINCYFTTSSTSND